MEINTCLENNAIPHKVLIHDCVDTGNSLTLLQDVTVAFPVDCVARDYKTGSNLWDKLTSSFSDHIDDGLLFYKIKMTLNGAKGSFLNVRIYVPHPTFGDIEVDQFEYELHKNNTDEYHRETSFVYMGTDSEAKTYGFIVEITPTAQMILKARSIALAV